MTDLSPEGTVRRMWEALNARDYARAAGAIAEGCEWRSMPTGSVHRGPAPIINGLREFVGAFPDWHAEVRGVLAQDGVVVVEWTATGTFTQRFRGREPNGKRFERSGCSVAEVDRGVIVRYRDYFDRAQFLQQLGLIDLLLA